MCGAHRWRQTVARIEHDQGASENDHRLNADARSSVLRKAKRSGHAGRQSNCPRDGSPHVITRQKSPNEPGSSLGTQDAVDRWHNDEREEHDVPHPGRQRQRVNRIKKTKKKLRQTLVLAPPRVQRRSSTASEVTGPIALITLNLCPVLASRNDMIPDLPVGRHGFPVIASPNETGRGGLKSGGKASPRRAWSKPKSHIPPPVQEGDIATRPNADQAVSAG